jgi:hypothetical protein
MTTGDGLTTEDDAAVTRVALGVAEPLFPKESVGQAEMTAGPKEDVKEFRVCGTTNPPLQRESRSACCEA